MGPIEERPFDKINKTWVVYGWGGAIPRSIEDKSRSGIRDKQRLRKGEKLDKGNERVGGKTGREKDKRKAGSQDKQA